MLVLAPFLTYCQDSLSILFNRTGPPAFDWLLGKQGLGLICLQWTSKFYTIHHVKRTLLWGLCWGNHITQIQLQCACITVSQWNVQILSWKKEKHLCGPLTEVIVQGEFVVIPNLNNQSRRDPKLCVVKVPEVLLTDKKKKHKYLLKMTNVQALK